MSKETTRVRGIGFGGLLTLLFIALKLIDKIDWSWWWVLAPLWMPCAVALAIMAGCLLLALFQTLSEP